MKQCPEEKNSLRYNVMFAEYYRTHRKVTIDSKVNRLKFLGFFVKKCSAFVKNKSCRYLRRRL